MCAFALDAQAAPSSEQFVGSELRLHFVDEALDDRVLAPLGTPGQFGHRRARFMALADALERLVIAIFEQGIEAGDLGRVVEQVAPEDAEQARFRHERGQREKHEMAFRALPAPAIRRLRAEDAEVAIAAREHVVVAVVLREARGDGQFGQRSQQRVVVEIGGDPCEWTSRGIRARIPSPCSTDD